MFGINGFEDVKEIGLEALLRFLKWMSFFLGIMLIGQPIAQWVVSQRFNAIILGIIAILFSVFLDWKYRSKED